MFRHKEENELRALEDKRLHLLGELRKARARIPLPVGSKGLSSIEDKPGFWMRYDEKTLRLPDLIDQLEARLGNVEARIDQIIGLEHAA